jgi:D-3-phosphoglycerate dehydrogenase
MAIHILIPDDYQFATQQLDFLQHNDRFHCSVLGDLSKDSLAD